MTKIREMEIKGTAVKITQDFVKEKYPKDYVEWLRTLPEPASKIFLTPIFATQWYSLYNSVILPTEHVGKMFFDGNNIEAASELGRYSSDIALKGIYKIFIKISSPQFVLSRAANVFSTYYNPADIKIIEKENNRVVLQLNQFCKTDELIMYRIGGWIEQTLKITLKSEIRLDIDNKYSGNSLSTKITAMWQ